MPAAPRPRLALIAAVARNGVIGAGNALPWRLPEDLKRFRALTTGHAVIMGRRTWDSIGRPLPQRQNIVVTRTPGWHAEGAQPAGSLAAALAQVALPEPAFCIGGGELYTAAIGMADVLHITAIDRDFAGDAHFPAIDPAHWREAAREPGHDAGAGFDYAFLTYTRAP
ncbi:MAG: dihydrofolate reductase [Burkholderiales bacterium]